MVKTRWDYNEELLEYFMEKDMSSDLASNVCLDVMCLLTVNEGIIKKENMEEFISDISETMRNIIPFMIKAREEA